MPTSGRAATLAATPTPSTQPIVDSVPPSAVTKSGNRMNIDRLIAPAKCSAHAIQKVRV